MKTKMVAAALLSVAACSNPNQPTYPDTEDPLDEATEELGDAAEDSEETTEDTVEEAGDTDEDTADGVDDSEEDEEAPN